MTKLRNLKQKKTHGAKVEAAQGILVPCFVTQFFSLFFSSYLFIITLGAKVEVARGVPVP